ncbi:hypothetical protein [Solirubrobacter deserti]|uniref:Uncharacterized protein n=1 Tax=Solirubrobacter deserti TaxID=2282478 RepID=A0ABT4RMC8_9ACTN|nr:hypothetical protein [Solirubrobacter deserti]MDA0139435.1 hypothetical protein [Solirubrobacter deserti]
MLTYARDDTSAYGALAGPTMVSQLFAAIADRGELTHELISNALLADRAALRWRGISRL